MKLKKLLHNTLWFLTFIFILTSFGGGIVLILKASEPVEPQSSTSIKLNSKKVKHKFLSAKDVIKNKKSKKKPKIHKKNKLIKSAKFKPNLTAGNILEKPSALRRAIPNLATVKRIKTDPKKINDKRTKERRIANQKRRYSYMDKRIERLEKRLEKLKSSENPNQDQVDRLEKSLERIKKRKIDLEKRLQDTGAI